MTSPKPNSMQRKSYFNKSMSWQKHFPTRKYHAKKRQAFLRRNVHKKMSRGENPEGKRCVS